MAKDYLNHYAQGVNKFQEGGAMAPEGMAPEGMAPEAPQGGGGDLQSMLMQYAETRDPQLAVAICDTLVEELAAQGAAAQGQGAPMPAARKGGRFNSNAPVFKRGGKLA